MMIIHDQYHDDQCHPTLRPSTSFPFHFTKYDRFDRAVTSDIKEIRHIPDDPYKVYNDMSYQNYHSIKMKNMVSKTKYTSEHYRSSTGVDQEIWRKELQLPPIQSALPWPSEKGGQAIQPIVWATWLPSWHCLWNLSTGPREASGKEFLNQNLLRVDKCLLSNT